MAVAAVSQHPAVLSYALSYARRGWPVFPLHTPRDGGCSCTGDCGKIGKHPRTEHGLSDATTDEQQIREWWTRWPDANVAVATGPSRLVVLDIDPRNGGDGTWSALALAHDPIGLTPCVMTGGGGSHIYLAAPYGMRVVSRGDALGEGVDCKGEGGYVVAPPSLHESGERYRWRPGADPGETDLCEAPGWIARAVEQPARERGKLLDGVTSWVLVAFEAAGWLGKPLPRGGFAVRCPWQDEHTSGREGDSSTVILPATTEHPLPWFHCSHSHCSGRTIAELRAALPPDAVREADELFPVPPEAHSSGEWVASESYDVPEDPDGDYWTPASPKPEREPGDDTEADQQPEPAWAKTGAITARDLVSSVRERARHLEQQTRVSTCHRDLDAVMRGYRRGNVAILGALTSWGKSSYAIMLADEAIDDGQRVLIVSTEDPACMYADRMAARRVGLSAQELGDGKLSEQDAMRIGIEGSRLPNVPVVLPAVGRPIEWVGTAIKVLCVEFSYDLVVLDYLQAAGTSRKTQDRRTEINHIARTVTDAIKSSNAAGLIVSQFKRLERGTKPTMHDLKESGDLENMAEHVLLGWLEGDSRPPPAGGGLFRCLRLAKNKDGPPLPMAVNLPFDDTTASFRRFR